ncbi:alkaline phosphatase family protein [Mucilaginibacter phyllosphaerae]|uniref:AlkP superfamily pyrophosphatase or phosphodiesterase n=1 Tax=Mucilaginibacter phyllosphaerae TaxID=1812349 RepID=A0A4Y8AJ33_9SPHI|nr:ectonucleotide pyrophosphatase/phosphodiesterase [Mucilaginibacter phyllosphaerae]MBB3967910.1 putative AlkP superfamily pyrophosphatase or phosphodiesterase [Mucilaginibacter phyllosphaerae]TEW69050.1 alkaline phosphatase family protein [Mucilaginibacter phyllosphaerae]GGH02470.1 alkaline phosphatase family protein [Mucilaginibacter phyllosphaerae]
MKKYNIALLLLFAVVLNSFCQDTVQKIIPGRRNSPQQQKKPYVILISADGFRYDFAKRYNAGHLLSLGSQGVSASSMIPSYPSVTFPNHYAITSGLYPSHSGLVNNTFYDRGRKDKYSMSNKLKVADGSWYGGSPLWVLAEQQKMLSASFYWVASEAEIKGIRPTYYYVYNEKIAIGSRIKAVTDWLNLPPAERPHLITFYFPQVDHAAHLNGPESPEVEREVHFVDSAVNELQQAVKATGLKNVNFIFVSDHGMTRVDNKNPIGIPAAIDTAKFVISGDGILVELYAKNKQDIAGTYQALKKEADGYDVYLKTNVPAHLHYGVTDDWHNRIGDILLIPRPPKVFNLWNSKKINPGWHGYDPSVVKDMHASFYAWGPAFKQGLTIPAFENVSVFNLVSSILGIKHTQKVDGNNKLPNLILKK